LPQALFRHARSPQYAGPLHVGRRAHDDDNVTSAFTLGFEQEWDVQNHKVAPGGPLACDKTLGLGANERVKDGFETAQRGLIAENLLAQRGPIHRPVLDDAGKFALDRRNSAAAGAKKRVDRRV